ncbi:hypothetical protein JCM11641_002872 [Rhodosporidiobolus odoratus]
MSLILALGREPRLGTMVKEIAFDCLYGQPTGAFTAPADLFATATRLCHEASAISFPPEYEEACFDVLYHSYRWTRKRHTTLDLGYPSAYAWPLLSLAQSHVQHLAFGSHKRFNWTHHSVYPIPQFPDLRLSSLRFKSWSQDHSAQDVYVNLTASSSNTLEELHIFYEGFTDSFSHFTNLTRLNLHIQSSTSIPSFTASIGTATILVALALSGTLDDARRSVLYGSGPQGLAAHLPPSLQYLGLPIGVQPAQLVLFLSLLATPSLRSISHVNPPRQRSSYDLQTRQLLDYSEAYVAGLAKGIEIWKGTEVKNTA